MSDVTITVRPNGSLRVEGPVKLVDGDGNPYNVEKDPIFLCRCGHSKKKPFCDSSHKHAEFDACETANELRQRLAEASADRD